MRKKPGLYWWVGLSWRSASMKRAWREVTSVARQILQAMGLDERSHINRSSYEVRLPGLGEIWFRTADNPSSLAGEGIQGAVLDEFTLMQEIVWTEYVEATLLDYGGWVAFIGVPKGKNWGANLWYTAVSRPGWQQLHASSYDNPYIDGKLLDEIKAHSTQLFWRQEYLAEIVSDEGLVFRRVTDAIGQIPETAERVVFGVDWAKYNDYTVITAVDTLTGAVLEVDRFNQIDYHLQIERLWAMYERWKPFFVLAEGNSMGDPLIEQLQRQGMRIEGFQTTAASKPQLIEALALAFERGELTIPSYDVLVTELQAYEMERMQSGRFRYNAPAGLHDDCVMSLALAWWARLNNQPSGGIIVSSGNDRGGGIRQRVNLRNR